MLLLQLSIVSRRFGQAVLDIVRTQPALLIGWRPLNSRLILGWAPFITKLMLDINTDIADLLGFLALSPLTCLELRAGSGDGVYCANADFLPEECKHLQELNCTGGVVPNLFPRSLQRLQLHLDHAYDDSEDGWSLPGTASFGLILRLKRLPFLQYLTLNVNIYGQLPHEDAPQLPMLQRLTVGLSLNMRESDLDFRWVKAQPCQELWVYVDIGYRLEGWPKVADQLQQLNLHRLYLDVRPRCVHQLDWQQLSAVQRGGLTIKNPRPILQLEHLPSFTELHIKVQLYGASNKTYISWEALLRVGGRVMIEKERWCVLHLTSAENIYRVKSLSTPWQLTVSCDTRLHGLPPSMTCKSGTYFWQNQAAVSAGWEQPDEWDQGSNAVQWSSFSTV